MARRFVPLQGKCFIPYITGTREYFKKLNNSDVLPYSVSVGAKHLL
ncbi:hypothetical protein KsCSTR_38520 [Candidatus Kuenenia stuttgartiensis]|uniref:Uncharacterized protein n=1 Tax=Kuenenia stuttgartiensis TaxID=174633 RepID=A0A6G7GUV0_KUEST|nr:hypothetical protein KsCSTR_38520 [Candidatus Kuenenia stuttgartiensis]